MLFAEFRTEPDKHKLRTPSGRIELVSRQARELGLPELPVYEPPRESRRDPRRPPATRRC